MTVADCRKESAQSGGIHSGVVANGCASLQRRKPSTSAANPPAAREALGVLTAVGAGLALTLGGLFVSLVVHIPALTVSGLRSTCAVLYLLPFLAVFRPTLVPKKGRLELAVVSLVFAIKFLTFTLGSVKLPLAEFSLLLNTTPLFAALLSCIFLREPCGPRETVGGAVVLAGVSIVFLPSLLLQHLAPSIPPTPAPFTIANNTPTYSPTPSHLTTHSTSRLTTLPVTVLRSTPKPSPALTTRGLTLSPLLNFTTSFSTASATSMFAVNLTSSTPSPINVTSAALHRVNATSSAILNINSTFAHSPSSATSPFPSPSNNSTTSNSTVAFLSSGNDTFRMSPKKGSLLASLAATSSLTSPTGITVTLISSVANAVALVWLRRLCDVSPLVIAFWASVATSVLCLPTAFVLGQFGTWDRPYDLLYIALSGATCLMSSYLPAVACSLTHAGRVAIAMTSGVIFSFALQALVQMVAPTPWSLVGGGFIVAAVIITNVDVSDITGRCEKGTCDDLSDDHSSLRDSVKHNYGTVVSEGKGESKEF